MRSGAQILLSRRRPGTLAGLTVRVGSRSCRRGLRRRVWVPPRAGLPGRRFGHRYATGRGEIARVAWRWRAAPVRPRTQQPSGRESQPRQLGRGVLGIVHEQVGILGQRDGCLVKDAGAVRAGTEGDRAVIRKVGRRHASTTVYLPPRPAPPNRGKPRRQRLPLQLDGSCAEDAKPERVSQSDLNLGCSDQQRSDKTPGRWLSFGLSALDRFSNNGVGRTGFEPVTSSVSGCRSGASDIATASPTCWLTWLGRGDSPYLPRLSWAS